MKLGFINSQLIWQGILWEEIGFCKARGELRETEEELKVMIERREPLEISQVVSGMTRVSSLRASIDFSKCFLSARSFYSEITLDNSTLEAFDNYTLAYPWYKITVKSFSVAL